MIWSRRLAAAAVVALVPLFDRAVADPAPAFSVLLKGAEQAAPRLAESAAQVRVAEGLAVQSGARPNPTLGYLGENLGLHDSGAGANGGPQQRQDTFSVNQPFELGGKRSARMAAGQAEVTAAEARQTQAQAEFAANLAVAYASAEAASRKAALLRDDLTRAREDARAVQALVQAGKEADVRAGQARAAAAGAEADLQAADADLAEALARLSSLAGAPAPFTSLDNSLLDTADALPDPSPDPPQATPAMAVARAERDAAARRTEVERSKVMPDVTLSLGARRYEGFGGTGVVAGVSAPLPLFDRNRGAVAAARGQQAVADARLRVTQLDAEADWRASAAQARAGRARLGAALEARTTSAESYRLTRIGYEAGKASLLELLGSRRALVEAETRLLDARFARIRAEASLARLAGRIPFGG